VQNNSCGARWRFLRVAASSNNSFNTDSPVANWLIRR
jgi:hypothetical protein